MHKFLFTLLFALFVAPTIIFAAFDDATLTTDVVIAVGGINLSITGSSAVVESITVDSDRFFFTILSGSALQVTSSDKRVLSTNSPVQYITTNECGSSSSILKISSASNESRVVTITPQTSTCGTNATSPAVSASTASTGGGGLSPAALNSRASQSSAVAPAPAPAPAPAVKSAAPATLSVAPAPFAASTIPSVSTVFTRSLSPKTSHSDVKRLQQLLNSDPDTRIAESGIGSPGNETVYFGSLTTKAIQKFQMKYGVAKPGDVGYGSLGPKTRAKVQEVFGSEKPSVPAVTTPAAQAVQTTPASSVSPVFNRALAPGSSHTDVKRLQQLLNSDPDTRIAESGVGSPGNETAYFGSLTTKAIQKFQVKYGVAKPGDVGYGNFGPKTRAKVQEVFGK